MIALAFPIPGHTAHWAWVERMVAPVPWDYTAFPMFMAYDKSDQKLTLVINDESSHTVRVWKFSPPQWIKVWEGTPDVGDISSQYYFRYVPNMYFDDNLNSLVIWGYCPGYKFETGCHALFKYRPGEGFVRITECMPLSTVYSETYPNFSITFDAQRRRAVFVGGFVMYLDGSSRFVTIEYDGSILYYIRNNPEPPEDILFAVGTSGYDPCSNRVVFYGKRRTGYPLETWEYDGQTWTLVPTASGPPATSASPPVIGMLYIPELGGLLAKPNDWGVSNVSWIYSGGHWRALQIEDEFANRVMGLMCYDRTEQAPVFYGGLDVHGDFINEMLKLQCMKHCKPLTKP
jgi:hypothetical protein